MHGQYNTRLKDFRSLINQINDTEKTEDGTATDAYLPTKSDCERAIRKLKKDTSRNEFNVSDVLDILENDIKETGKKLNEGWINVTKENMKNWFN